MPSGAIVTMEIDKAKAAGFDYAELGVKTFTGMPDEEWQKFLAKHKEIGLPTPTNAILTDIVLRVEKGELKPDPKHITDLRLN